MLTLNLFIANRNVQQNSSKFFFLSVLNYTLEIFNFQVVVLGNKLKLYRFFHLDHDPDVLIQFKNSRMHTYKGNLVDKC